MIPPTTEPSPFPLEVGAHIRARITEHQARLTELKGLADQELARNFYKRRTELLLMLDRETVKSESALQELEAALACHEQKDV